MESEPETPQDAEDIAAVAEADREQGDTPLRPWAEVDAELDEIGEPAPEPTQDAMEVADLDLQIMVHCKRCCGGWLHFGQGRCDHPTVRKMLRAFADSHANTKVREAHDAGERDAFVEGSKYTNASERAMFYWEAIANKPHKGPRFIDHAIADAVKTERERVRELVGQCKYSDANTTLIALLDKLSSTEQEKPDE